MSCVFVCLQNNINTVEGLQTKFLKSSIKPFFSEQTLVGIKRKSEKNYFNNTLKSN